MSYTNFRRRSSFSGPKRASGPTARFNGRAFGGGSSQKKKGRKKEYISPERFVKAARAVVEEQYVPQNTFSDFAIAPLIASNIVKRGFVNPSPIQDQAIPEGLAGRDVIGIANTGTGKTVAFGIPVLHMLITDPAKSALIVAPTRELAQQIHQELSSLSRGSGIFDAVLIGGSPMGPQFKSLSRQPSIVIGTPGRIKDHIQRGSIKMKLYNIVVLDEVDRMLDMGFVNDMRYILGELPATRQSYFFSATMDAKVRSIIDDFSKDPVSISVKTGDTTDNVEQGIVKVEHSSHKIDKLHDILIAEEASKVLIFDDTQRSVERLSKTLVERGFKADSLHGGKTQGQRKRALDKFKENHTNVLVATDVAARGIDVPGITHVINFSTPQSYSDYVHRIGRAGRAGKTGKALTFIEPS
ncbi:DEAD/DEAH box helicase [Candidatus Saccharibacteria bacterium]|nr:DEAD/DEAH box helicase [Candidatus Saccharibacteria bacterium]